MKPFTFALLCFFSFFVFQGVSIYFWEISNHQVLAYLGQAVVLGFFQALSFFAFLPALVRAYRFSKKEFWVLFVLWLLMVDFLRGPSVSYIYSFFSLIASKV